MKTNIVYLLGGLCLALCAACEKICLDPPGHSEADFIVENTFTNPLVPRGADPWVTQKNGTYYFTYTQGGKLVLYETKAMSELALATPHDAWIPEQGMPYSKNLWAPELHAINNKWYIYFAADNGSNANHRMYVVENSSPDPMQGNWVLKGKVADPSDEWAIDGTVLTYKGQMYMLWSGGNAGAAPQHIYIAKMSNPWTIESEKVAIASPAYPWEMNGSAINEGPQVLISPNGQVLVVYSGSGFWVDTYCLGLLSLKADGDPMNPADWTKTPDPVFSMNAESGAYGPGHNGFFKSPDGTEDWIIYHARSAPGGGSRNARIQKFTWHADGTPDFGVPVKIGAPVQKPSGEPIRKIYRTDNWSIAGYSSEELANDRLAIRLIDNNVFTFWITRYSTAPTHYPDHWITVDMGDTLAVDGFILVQKSGDRKIKELELLVGNDNQTWESLGVVELLDLSPNRQYIDLAQRKQCRYFKLVPVSGHDSQEQPGLAEAAAFILEE
ncbi:family 43 glycosylhydrolase [Chitinophaga japonensis]|uniref:GH43 family beta-xylosidase n=1 Tax=Chitinophaga japonensis TaxID=104662 RepID=A0A562T5P2_CHIJA|nr:family 43 glycosylhydrolase [Chitinophaga japonensis]TWI88812.1 GH43 family beta-xylosidase [Chitinophaga japonensis]